VTKPFTIKALVDKINLLLQDAQKSILVVDDDKALVKSIKYELEKRDYATYVAYNGKEALATIKSHLPDLILLDIMMPEMDGYEVMKALKSKPETANISIVVMTGIDIDGGRVKALSVGATEYLTKSGGFDKMFKAIENILYSKSSV
jgi:CheY-like chemotaxis protein